MKRERKDYENDMKEAAQFLNHPYVAKKVKRAFVNAVVDIWDSSKVQDRVDISTSDLELEILCKAAIRSFHPLWSEIAPTCVDELMDKSAKLEAGTYKASDDSSDDSSENADHSDEAGETSDNNDVIEI